MALYSCYNPFDASVQDYPGYLNQVKQLGFNGVYFDLADKRLDDIGTEGRVQLKDLYERIRARGLETGLMLRCYHNKDLYRNEFFTAPISRQGVSYTPRDDYFPICLNNPIGQKLLNNTINEYLTEFNPDLVYLEHVQFPFNWAIEDLDIQDKIPQFCYCPFCITEFSSVVGEIITNSEQIDELMPEWLEWRAEVVLDLLRRIKPAINSSIQLTIALPPLAIIDLSFSTGLLPHSLIEGGVNISPQLLHLQTSKKLIWIEDLLDQYQIDLNTRKIFPMFEFSNQNEFHYLRQFESQFGGLVMRTHGTI